MSGQSYEEELAAALSGAVIDSSVEVDPDEVIDDKYDHDMIQVLVKTLSGQTITVEVKSNGKVSELQQKISDKSGISQLEQRLIYGGKQLDPDQPISAYNIVEGSMVNLVLRLRGGGRK